MSRVALGIDIGGTKIAAGLVDADGGAALDVQTVPCPAREGGSEVVAACLDLARRVLDDAPRVELVAVGVGTAGVVDGAGRVTSATDLLRDWEGVPLGELVASAFGVPAAVLNDVHAFGLAEATRGSGAGAPSVLAVSVGTGIGGAFLAHGEVMRGRTGTAGSIAHIPTRWERGRRCGCGRSGHVEAVSSGPAIESEYAGRTGSTVPLAEIAVRADDGDAIAVAVIREAGLALGEALAAVVDTLDPDVVVLGGGVLNLRDRFLAPVREALTAHALPGPATVPVVSGAVPHAVVVGAGLYAARRLSA